MSRKATKGIFCLEGDWEPDLRSDISVLPYLELLARANHPRIPYIRRDIATIHEIDHYLGKWCQKRYQDYPILYLGFHGSPGRLFVGSRKAQIDLDWLEDRLEGRCRGRIIHFGSCGTLAAHGHRLNRFLARTGALAVCGYKVEVDWMLAAAFEIILLSGFQKYTLTRSGMKALQRCVKREAGGLVKDLAFRLVIAPPR